ncbi:unnamed protein product [Anisakis simplex]|uniref:7TM_GPCR_Srx domain-containing protein n=1 Tax=Anisakis simplex TaxID=6269 RepID=A0A0M3K402_ANISI|nr:unnamed protein product [Anisakis simplex]
MGVGILLHVAEIFSCVQLWNAYPGFYFIAHFSAVDILLLLQYGIWGGAVVLTHSEITTPGQRIFVNIFINFTWYVVLYYNPYGYSVTGDWKAYLNNGSRTYYTIFNGLTVLLNFVIYVLVMIELVKITRKRRLIVKASSTGVIDNHRMSATLGTRNAPANERGTTIDNFRRSAEFGLLLSCFTSWIGFIFQQMLINWLHVEAHLEDFLINTAFMTQCWTNTLMRAFLSILLRQKMMNLLKDLICCGSLKRHFSCAAQRIPLVSYVRNSNVKMFTTTQHPKTQKVSDVNHQV